MIASHSSALVSLISATNSAMRFSPVRRFALVIEIRIVPGRPEVVNRKPFVYVDEQISRFRLTRDRMYPVPIQRRNCPSTTAS